MATTDRAADRADAVAAEQGRRWLRTAAAAKPLIGEGAATTTLDRKEAKRGIKGRSLDTVFAMLDPKRLMDDRDRISVATLGAKISGLLSDATVTVQHVLRFRGFQPPIERKVIDATSLPPSVAVYASSAQSVPALPSMPESVATVNVAPKPAIEEDDDDEPLA
jgi:hypothetical protein